MPQEVVFKLSFSCSYEHWLAILFKSKKKQCQCQIVMWETVWCSRCELICRTASLVQSSKWFPAGQSSAHLPNLITILSPRASWATDSLKKPLRYKFRNKIKVLGRHFHKHIRQWKGTPHSNRAVPPSKELSPWSHSKSLPLSQGLGSSNQCTHSLCIKNLHWGSSEQQSLYC